MTLIVQENTQKPIGVRAVETPTTITTQVIIVQIMSVRSLSMPDLRQIQVGTTQNTITLIVVVCRITSIRHIM